MTFEGEAVAIALARLSAAAGVDPADGSKAAGKAVVEALGGPKLGPDLDTALRAWVVRGSGVAFAHPGVHGPIPRLLLTNGRALLVRTVQGRPIPEGVLYPPCVLAAVAACGGTGDSPPGRRRGGTRRKREGGAAC